MVCEKCKLMCGRYHGMSAPFHVSPVMSVRSSQGPDPGWELCRIPNLSRVRLKTDDSRWRPMTTRKYPTYRRGSRIFERGGSRRGYRIFHKHPPPLDIARVTSSNLRKFEKHPHSWTFTSTPPLDIVCVTSSAIRKIEKHPHSWTFTKGGGPTLGPNVKKPTLWPKRGGSGPPGPPPWIRHWPIW